MAPKKMHEFLFGSKNNTGEKIKTDSEVGKIDTLEKNQHLFKPEIEQSSRDSTPEIDIGSNEKLSSLKIKQSSRNFTPEINNRESKDSEKLSSLEFEDEKNKILPPFEIEQSFGNPSPENKIPPPGNPTPENEIPPPFDPSEIKKSSRDSTPEFENSLSINQFNSTENIDFSKKDIQTYWDYSRDHFAIKFLDHKNNIIKFFPVQIYCLSKNNIGDLNSYKGDKYYDRSKEIYIIINPPEDIVINNKNILTDANKNYEWYLLDQITKKNNLMINTNWNPIFLEDISMITTYDVDETTIFICENSNEEKFKEYRNNYILIPILDTLIYLHQEFYNCTLLQIAMIINHSYSSNFSSKKNIMEFLFNFFKKEFEDLCKTEKISIHKLYNSNFNLKLNHSGTCFFSPAAESQIINLNGEIRASPLSLICGCEYSYGNIPWLSLTEVNREEIRKKLIMRNGPIGYYLSTERFNPTVSRSLDDKIYSAITIFPPMEFKNKKYQSFSIAFTKEKDSEGKNFGDFILKGDFFDGVSIRENLILREMYYSFWADCLKPDQNFRKTFSTLFLNDEQFKIRDDFIDKIYELLCSIRGQ